MWDTQGKAKNIPISHYDDMTICNLHLMCEDIAPFMHLLLRNRMEMTKWQCDSVMSNVVPW